MASRFASISEEEIFKINKEGTPLNTKKATKFGVSVFNGKFFSLNVNSRAVCFVSQPPAEKNYRHFKFFTNFSIHPCPCKHEEKYNV